MEKVVLSPEGKIIHYKRQNRKKVSDNLIVGLTTCLEKLGKMRDVERIERYLTFGNEESLDIKEEIARLLLLATTFPTNMSPTIDISNKLLENHVININSMFIKEFLELEERNKTTSFMKSDFYYLISKKVEEMELKMFFDEKYSLNDSLILIKNIRNLYVSNLDQNIMRGKLDLRFREPLIELFQCNLDNTHEKIKNGVINNVQLQTRHQ